MNVFTKTVACLFVVVFVCCTLTHKASSQNVNSISLSSSGDTARWDTVLVGEEPINNNVTIMTGDTVSLDSSATCASLTIRKGAILNSICDAANGDTYLLQPGTGQASGIAATKDTVDNEGVFGSSAGANDGITLAIPEVVSYLRLMGGGTTAIGAIRPSTINQNLTFDLAQNASLNYNGIAFSALPLVAGNSVANKISFNIDTGKTLSIINPRGQWQGDPGVLGGNYTYNIYGALDLTATQDTQMMVPDYSSVISAASVTTVNIIGKLNLGAGLNSANSGTAAGGSIAFNIFNGGMADASRTTVLNMGTSYFVTNGTGVLVRKVDDLGETFPVGAQGSATYSPVTLTNKGTPMNFSVSVKNQFDYSVPNSNKTVNKQWTVTADSTGTLDVIVSPQWLSGDQAAGFDPSKPLSIIRYNGTDWIASNAGLSGLGTAANPYAATANGFLSLGQFGVENTPVNNQSVTKMTVYPNPVLNNFTVSFPAATANGSLGIASINGEKLLSAPVSSGQASWEGNISGWAPGIYIITLQQGGKRTSAKLIKL